jgi:ATP-dependent DNA ligase
VLRLWPPYLPIEALSVDVIPPAAQWQYEPKWDGFRCLVFRDRNRIELQAKSGKLLTRYFPDLADTMKSLKAGKFVLDGEIVIVRGRRLSFDDLLQRIHPTESRIRKLAAETPATFIAFDILIDEAGRLLTDRPLHERRVALEKFIRKFSLGDKRIRLSPATRTIRSAKSWLKRVGGALDGIIAKRVDREYRSGDRTAMQKIKNYRSADCVVGGFRYGQGRKIVGSLLLGLYDDKSLLHHVGFTSALKDVDRPALTKKLELLVKPPGFTGNAPDGPSRWSTERSAEWKPLKPKLVIEVGYDHFSGGRFRHGTGLLRWRPDKAPRQCTFDQVKREGANMAALLK